MKCDQSLKPVTALAQCSDVRLNVRPFVTGVITEITPHRDGWQIEGNADQYGQWCTFFTTDADTASVEIGQRFELDVDSIKIYPSVD